MAVGSGVKARDVTDLVLLAAIWGASFLFMRQAGPAFGPLPLIELRVGLAALLLLPVLAIRGGLRPLATHWKEICFVGFSNSALPFVLYAWALLSVTAGFAAVVNASSPLWAALVAFVWLGVRLPPAGLAGLVIGFIGVVLLSWGKAGFRDGGSGFAVLACIGATLSYGIAANFTKRRLAGVPALAIAAGSQFYAALLLLPFAVAQWPARTPRMSDWLAVIALAVLCTGLAYFLYFRLIETVGPARAISVTFLVPLFGMLWGAMFANEAVSSQMLLGCAVIVFGTALASGRLNPGRRVRAGLRETLRRR